MVWRGFCFGLAMVLVGLSSVFPAAAQGAYTNTADNLALGLDRLRWGMTSEEVHLVYPDLNFTPTYGVVMAVDPNAAWGPPAMKLANYRHGSCTFDLYLTFYHARLRSVGLHSTNEGDGLRDCRREVRRELTALYGPPQGGYPHFPGPVTIADFDVPFFSAPLNPTPGPRPLNIGLFDANDISGYDAAIKEDARNFCQRIGVAFLPDSSGTGATTPVLAPRLNDLGCDYPPVSLRLQEQGKVVLNVRVLADGTVDKAEVAIPDSHMRLNGAAVDVVQKKIQLIPAMKDGKQVEVQRQIAVTFDLIRPIRGQP